ncbi:MAG: tetratricopeptide repeat protein, partial [Syntrophorhabdales bacterium]
MTPEITPPKSTDDKPPDIMSLAWKIVSRYFKGRLGILIFIILLLTLGSWWQWDKVRQLPGINRTIVWLFEESVPKADPNRFAVLVAHIEDDQGDEFEKLVIEALKEFDGVQTLRLDRLIPLEGAYPEEMEKRGHAKAREYLTKSGAQVLIWGRVIRTSGRSVPKLYWTESVVLGTARNYGRYQPTEDLHLPAIFWEDLAQVLRLLITTQSAEFYAIQGQYIGDEIRPFIGKVRELLKGSEGKPGWNQEARAQTYMVLGNSLEVIGEQKGENQAFIEAIQAYQEVLKEHTRERMPLDWAATQNNQCVVLRMLGEREGGTKRLEEAVEACREALKERIRGRVPLDWAMTQHNLGNTLTRLGDRETGTKRLEEAVGAYREALKEYTRGRVPLYWGITQNSLGVALAMLGERESGTKRLEEALDACREALKVCTQERVPLYWAMTQDNLSYALRVLGKRETGTKRLEEAVDAC